MRYFNRGQSIAFTHTFYDSSGDVTSPSSARLTINFPTSGSPYRTQRDTTYLTLTQLSSTHATAPLAYVCTWQSLAAYPGPVFWSIRADDLSLAVEDGQLLIRGNPANLTITTTT
jgi:hypothetical protein